MQKIVFSEEPTTYQNSDGETFSGLTTHLIRFDPDDTPGWILQKWTSSMWADVKVADEFNQNEFFIYGKEYLYIKKDFTSAEFDTVMLSIINRGSLVAFLSTFNQYFDVVILGFCLYLVDRELLFKTISEVDRTLKQGGYLVITDFETPFPIKRNYEHLEGCFSYKNNYSNFFLGGGHYSLVNKIHTSHSTDMFNPDINERVSTSVLYKEHYSKIYRLG